MAEEDGVISFVWPLKNTTILPNTTFAVEAVTEWPPDFLRGTGVWEQRHEQATFFVPCDSRTLIQSVDANPFSVSCLQELLQSKLRSTIAGGFDIRLRVLDEKNVVAFTSNVQRIQVGTRVGTEPKGSPRAA